MKIIYKINQHVSIDDVIDVYNSSGINRPTKDKMRIEKMFTNSNLIISAWHEFTLVGISRALTDYNFCCYLSDLAVRKDFQHKGIGKRMVEITKEQIGDECMLLLLAAPEAIDYYPKIGMEKVENGFIIKRSI